MALVPLAVEMTAVVPRNGVRSAVSGELSWPSGTTSEKHSWPAREAVVGNALRIVQDEDALGAGLDAASNGRRGTE